MTSDVAFASVPDGGEDDTLIVVTLMSTAMARSESPMNGTLFVPLTKLSETGVAATFTSSVGTLTACRLPATLVEGENSVVAKNWLLSRFLMSVAVKATSVAVTASPLIQFVSVSPVSLNRRDWPAVILETSVKTCGPGG